MRQDEKLMAAARATRAVAAEQEARAREFRRRRDTRQLIITGQWVRSMYGGSDVSKWPEDMRVSLNAFVKSTRDREVFDFPASGQEITPPISEPTPSGVVPVAPAPSAGAVVSPDTATYQGAGQAS